MKIFVINGPNLNMLGMREPDIYGTQNYESLCRMITDYCGEKGVEVDLFQSNHEGVIVDKIQSALFEDVDGIVINPAAYTHTSVAILDALKCVKIPTVEVHISDINRREEFRKKSFITPICKKTICGKGLSGYIEAIEFLIEKIK